MAERTLYTLYADHAQIEEVKKKVAGLFGGLGPIDDYGIDRSPAEDIGLVGPVRALEYVVDKEGYFYICANMLYATGLIQGYDARRYR